MITAANGTPVHNISDLATIFEEIGVGHEVKLSVVRNGQSRRVEVPIADISGLQQG